MLVAELEELLWKEHPREYGRYEKAALSISKSSGKECGDAFRLAMAVAYSTKGVVEEIPVSGVDGKKLDPLIFKKMAFVGWHATLAYLVNTFGWKVAKYCEGDDDLDMVAFDDDLVTRLTGVYGSLDVTPSNKADRRISQDKWKFVLKSMAYVLGTGCSVLEDDEIEAEVDLWRPKKTSSPKITFGGNVLDRNFFSGLKTVPLLKPVSMYVPDPITLMDLRSNFASVRREDVRVLYDLTTVLVAGGTEAEELFARLDKETRGILRDSVYRCQNEKLKAEPTIERLRSQDAYIEQVLVRTEEFVNEFCFLTG